MLGKKSEDKKPSEQDELIQRVDALMDPKATKKPDAPDSILSEAKPTPPPLDIFKDKAPSESVTTKTAPEVPGAIPVKVTKAAVKTAPEPKPDVAASEAKPIVEPVPDTESTEPMEISESNPEIDNADTDKAVADIVANEGDIVLAVADASADKAEKVSKDDRPGFKAKLKRMLKSKKTWAIVIALLVILFAIPQTRYAILGLAIKKQVTVVVTDSKTSTPVSAAQVELAGKTVKTDANGKAVVSARLGQSTLEITKQYYKSSNKPYFVGFKTTAKNTVNIVATGRQVPVSVINKITGKPVANAEVTVLNTSAKTDKKGKTVIVLPTTATTYDALIQAKGYNLGKVPVQVTDKIIKQNTFEITPVGHVYFLSNSNGKIDVVKTNLDGSGRQVVMAGTGKEEVSTTSLLASRDWKYVVLKARREGVRPVMYLIDTSNDKITEFDSSNSNFNLIGWYGHNFMYDLQSNTIAQSQVGHQQIKSYDADHLQLNQLDQTQAEGNPSNYGYTAFDNFYVVNNLLVYSVQWLTYDATGNGYSLANKNDAIRGVQPNGQNKKDYQTFPAAGVGYIQAAQYAPQSIYYGVYSTADNKTTYYDFSNQSVSTAKDIDQSDFSKAYPTYLVSPANSQTFWTDIRDGKNTLFVGDTSAKNQKQVGTLNDYAPYGWYGDQYLLVSKGKSQLYVIPVNGTDANKQPLKVTDYYKPATTLNGYGYGYGGL